ncbi:MAG: NAD-glutamate dehydrogenase, partial [Acidimicrobiia bacterium]|nr:NAD-glutamate dehydrogenase [Acidimicrobiia bacterium]
YTSRAYMEPASKTPILQRKLDKILVAEDLIEGSHDHKAVIQLFEGFSKHDLFAAPTEALRSELMGLLSLEERQQVKVFVRRDLLKRSISILVSLPRDRFNAPLRKQIQGMIGQRFGGGPIDYHLNLGEGETAQIHFTIWIEDEVVPEVDQDSLERDIIALARPWTEKLVDRLEGDLGNLEANRIANEWGELFPGYYVSQTPLEVVAGDVVELDKLMKSTDTFRVGVQADSNEDDPLTRIALYRKGGRSALSALMPALENLGVEVMEEVPTKIRGDHKAYIHDFGVRFDGKPIDIDNGGERIRNTLASVWGDEIATDPLHVLVVTTPLTHEDVGLLQAYRTYWKRVAPVFTTSYTNETLIAHPRIASDLVELFKARFQPSSNSNEDSIRKRILTALDEVEKLDHDRILRSMLGLVEATLRTNYYQEGRKVLSFKFRSTDVPDAPAPRPMAEIFVIGRGMEGIHLRGGPVARGGIRHSDRREDYRTEVLGLLKAQMTKNAVIVPTGAKGGFVIGDLPADREERATAVENQYRNYISALLDVTDNRVGDEIVHPPDTVIHDDDDPYLVVAADKGTAKFSDVANEIATSVGYWLDDAFASGGSAGYDHKALGITARGAWESLKRHFLEMGLDPAEDEFTAIGVGDMSGDVFGNGMLCSDKIRLVAAFNHLHIFIDPNPDAATSFQERKRLYELSMSSWADYDRDLISSGGGVFKRSAKSIKLSEEAQVALGTDRSVFTPDQLIGEILLAPVDLLWNGGIGTYVKASHETDAEADDRVNDSVRVNGDELRARVAVEGGNLGFTQHGRVEFALGGGHLNTDFIDNSAGVDASDREVNLKILLGRAEENGELERADRNTLIGEVVDEVVEKILYDNYLQAQMLSQEELGGRAQLEALEDLMQRLEGEGIVVRGLDGLPSTDEVNERLKAGQNLTRPELSVLLVDAKRSIYNALVDSDLPDDEYFIRDLGDYFPGAVVERFGDHLERFPLRRELAATILANRIVNDQGITFVNRLVVRTGATIPDIVRSQVIAREVMDAPQHWDRLEALFGKIDNSQWIDLMAEADLLVASATRWYLAHPSGGSIAEAVKDVALLREIEANIERLGTERWQEGLAGRVRALVEDGLDEQVARRHVISPILLHVPGAIAVAKKHDRNVTDVFDVFLHLGSAVGLARLNRMARQLNVEGKWARWARQSMEDSLINLRYELADNVVARSEPGSSMLDAVTDYLEDRSDVAERVARVVHALSSAPQDDVSPLLVAVRQLRNLVE